jgi:hypothetical protein
MQPIKKNECDFAGQERANKHLKPIKNMTTLLKFLV